MTGVTLIGGVDMRCGFARGGHTVMTTLAGAASFIVVHGRNRDPARIHVAGFTQICHVDMRYGTATLTRGDGAVMAGDTRFRCGAVIKRTDKPHGRNVADIASFDSGHMIDTLANRDHAVMAAFTTTGNLRMVHAERRYPGRAAVAGLAHLASRNMSGAFAYSGDAIMATAAVVSNPGVVEHRYQPATHHMTSFTGFRGRNMRCTHADRSHPIVATFAGADDFVMIHRDHRQPGRRHVTGITLIRGAEMALDLAGGDDAIMTTLAGATGFVVIHHSSGYPRR